MSQRQSARYLRTVSHSSQVVNSFELDEKQHPIHSMSESVHHIIPSSVDHPSSHSEHPPSLNIAQSQSQSHSLNINGNNSNNGNSAIQMVPPQQQQQQTHSNLHNANIIINNVTNNYNVNHMHINHNMNISHHIPDQHQVINHNMNQDINMNMRHHRNNNKYDEVEEESKSAMNNSSNLKTPNTKYNQSPELQEVRIFEPGYSQWQGTNRVCCKGLIIGGPEIWKLIVTTTIIIIPTILYLTFTYAQILIIFYIHYRLKMYIMQNKYTVQGYCGQIMIIAQH